MLIVKIAVLLIVISVIYFFFVKMEIKNMAIRGEYLKLAKIKTGKWTPRWMLPFAVLIILDIIAILASVVYLLFFL